MDTVVFDLRVKCDWRRDGARGETDPKLAYYDSDVYSGMLKWEPSGDQTQRYRGKDPMPVDPDILLVKLRPGQVSCDFIWVMRRGATDVQWLMADDRLSLFRKKRYWGRPRKVLASR